MTPRVLSILLVTLIASPAIAAEMPARKAGLWEITSSANSAMTIRQCVDAATDEMMQSRMASGPGSAPVGGAASAPSAQRQCSKHDVQKSANTITIDSVCTVMSKTVSSHVVLAGSFDSAYTMTVTSQGDGIPGGSRSVTMTVKWLGPCAADQKPGDMIMPGGMKINILDMQKRVMPGAPPPSR
jgi:hypothetical protein